MSDPVVSLGAIVDPVFSLGTRDMLIYDFSTPLNFLISIPEIPLFLAQKYQKLSNNDQEIKPIIGQCSSQKLQNKCRQTCNNDEHHKYQENIIKIDK